MKRGIVVDAEFSSNLDDDIESIQAVICDLNGILRGKRVPVSQLEKVLGGGIRMPLSILGVDIWGEDIIGSEQVFLHGDNDGICEPTGRGPVPVRWTQRPSAVVPLWMFEESGKPFLADPRQALAAVIAQYHDMGIYPVVGSELEFYLIDSEPDAPEPPISPYTGKRLDSDAILSIDELDDFGGFFSDVYEECARQNVPADAAVAENGIGQFEITLLHGNDPLKAADDIIFAKRIIKGVARRHGIAATFMAKPYGLRSGNGMHMHFSMVDKDGKNVFATEENESTDIFKHSVAGMLKAMPESTLLFAPHFNSFRRLRPDTHAPTSISWGFENRTAAIRIPGGGPKSRRIEHRVPGADSNPYLAMAGILGSALVGIRNKWMPPKPIEGRAYGDRLKKIPVEWGSAVDAFEEGEIMAEVFSPLLRNMLVACKRQEIAGFAEQVTDYEFSAYLEIV
nr:glutamine synthetase family protein [Rhizobium sp. L1K21]